jgi:hypothetical protein
MDNARYAELLNAILDLRNATELGFDNVRRRFDEVYSRFDEVYRRFDQMEERWEGRFRALETRVENGFRGVASSLDDIRHRLTGVEQS